MISLTDFSIGFGNKVLLDKISTDFRSGTLTALIGRNGAGKSTLLRAICGLNTDYSGEIFIEGKNLRDLSSSSLSRLLAFVHTKRPHISNMKCRDIVGLGRTPYTNWIGQLSETDNHLIDEALSYVGMQSFSNRKMDSLSDGEAQRIMVARAIAQDTPVIVLDEPTSFLDLPTRFELGELLKGLAHQKNKTILFSTHELDIALEMSDYIALINDGNLYNLPVDEMKKSGHLQKLFKSSASYITRLMDSYKCNDV